jgi:hypothetical protein
MLFQGLDMGMIRIILPNQLITIGSHSSHVPYACDLCEARIYAADTTSEEQRSIHQESTLHTYHYK